MVVQAYYPSWSNLASPEFSPFPGMSCLTFYWHSSTRDRTHILLVHARFNGRSRPVVQLHPADYMYINATASLKNVTHFSPVFVTIPAGTDRVYLQMKVATVDLSTVEMFEETLVFAIDDIFLTPGICRQASVNCTFSEPGMCGYTDPYMESNWKPRHLNETNEGRHLTFSDVTLGHGYITSPFIPQTPTSSCLSFDYEFDGVHGRRLAVYKVMGEMAEKKSDFQGELLWSLTSSAHQSWRSVRVPVNHNGTSGYAIVFEGLAGDEESDIIRVDNIILDPQACDEIECGLGEFKCASTLTCIPKEETCNSINDCSDTDLSDEANSNCARTTKCAFSDWFACGYRNSTGSEGFWVRWKAKEPTLMRLVGSRLSEESASGRVEVYHNGRWGNICDTGMTATTATVICRNLGYQSFVQFHCCLLYGRGTGRFLIYKLQCSGSESDVSDCSDNLWDVGNCGEFSVLGLTCEGKREEPDAESFEGIASVFSLQSDFTDIAHMVSPPLDCLQTSGGCSQTCLKVDMDGLSPLHTPLAIFGEDTSGIRRRLWTSLSAYSANSEAISVILPSKGLQRVHFLSYFNLRAKASIRIKRIEEQTDCVSNPGCTDLDPFLMCDGVADCPDGSDEWSALCSGNVSISCTFDDHHSCGYAGVSRLSPWKRGNASQIQTDFTWEESFRLNVPRSDHKYNTSGVMLYFVPQSCRTNLAINELLFPYTPELVKGGCLRIVHSSSGNFTLTSPEGHLYHVKGRGPSTISWVTTRVKIPTGTGPLSLIVDCLAGHMIVDEILFNPGECPAASTTTQYCMPGDTFLCQNGREIPCHLTCSGRNYCGDYSDEKDCRCRSNQVACGGFCRHAELFCDGKEDCPDGSDEQLDCGCPENISYTCTKDGHLSCKSASQYCHINKALRCDEEKDCCAGISEGECCDHMSTFICGSGDCISILYRCDYAIHCKDSSDEVNCTCRAHDFVCPNSGVCVKPAHVCDGIQNCPDGEDEGLHCFNCDENTEFKCKVTGLCVKKSQVCNGMRDCGDNSDEDNCSDCSKIGFRCETSRVCINKYRQCNGQFDCLTSTVDDVSDEANCVCAIGQTRCNNGACVYQEEWCDGVNNCHDNSDETYCDVCPPYYWKCRSGHCVHLEFRCDGYRDCDDGSDETNCLQCRLGQVASCNNHRCLNERDICDGRLHCKDETDEMHCGALLSGSETRGLVYFNKSGTRYPLCADNVVSNIHVMESLCHYLLSGSYVRAESVFVTSLTQDFLVYTSNLAKSGPLTSFLDVVKNACSGHFKMMLYLVLLEKVITWPSIFSVDGAKKFFHELIEFRISLRVIFFQQSLMRAFSSSSVNLDCDSHYDTTCAIFMHLFVLACGVRPSPPPGAPLIIGGEKSDAGEWPWMAEIRYLGSHLCGAVVINRNYVLTAAHCVQDTRLPFPKVASYYTVIIGSTRPTSHSSRSVIRRVERVIRHEGYFVDLDRRQLPDDDIALIKLLQPLYFTGPDVRPICLADYGSSLPINTVCLVAGWGMSIPGQPDSRTLDLHHARVRLVNDSDCRQVWSDAFNSTHSMICAGFGTNSVGSCHGDSGGPLMCLSPDGLWRVDGVVSFGAQMCAPDPSTGLVRPSAFTRVAEYREWIDRQIREIS
ncbi:uncharacterized protein LOC135463349 [Liolophura sinensis]|uniref:uncharacterized protein LOC135463349 n=1 Tax=Liolophura sinensis TaxID=3198878 RepID=UPI003158E304